ncbi:MAG: IS630 family transposase [Myxococcota bacterium]
MARGPTPERLRVPRSVVRELKKLVRRSRAPFAVVQRARMILLARAHVGTEETARRLGCSSRNVRKWKSRFRAEPKLVTLEDAPRSGRPATVPTWVRCRLIQIACDRPDGVFTPFRELWTHGALADELARQTKVRLSVSEVGRILRNAEMRPHRVRQWLHSPDPDFEEKAKRVCDLYMNPPRGAVVVCVDEKPMQVLERIHPSHVDPATGRLRYEYEYKRHGVQQLLAAFDIRTGRVFARVVPKRTAKATVTFMNALARRYHGREVYVVWDNLNTHCDGNTVQRWSDFNERHGGRFHFVFTPKHASWMNQVEIWFSILHRRVLQHGDFATRERQRWQVEAFIRHWNRVERHPFRWTWRVPERQDRRAA